MYLNPSLSLIKSLEWAREARKQIACCIRVTLKAERFIQDERSICVGSGSMLSQANRRSYNITLARIAYDWNGYRLVSFLYIEFVFLIPSLILEFSHASPIQVAKHCTWFSCSAWVCLTTEKIILRVSISTPATKVVAGVTVCSADDNYKRESKLQSFGSPGRLIEQSIEDKSDTQRDGQVCGQRPLKLVVLDRRALNIRDKRVSLSRSIYLSLSLSFSLHLPWFWAFNWFHPKQSLETNGYWKVAPLSSKSSNDKKNLIVFGLRHSLRQNPFSSICVHQGFCCLGQKWKIFSNFSSCLLLYYATNRRPQIVRPEQE